MRRFSPRDDSVILDAEADLQGHLKVRHLAINHMAGSLDDFKPGHVADRLGTGFNRIANRIQGLGLP